LSCGSTVSSTPSLFTYNITTISLFCWDDSAGLKPQLVLFSIVATVFHERETTSSSSFSWLSSTAEQAIYYPTYAPWWIQWNKFGNVNVIIYLSKFAKLNWDKPYTTCTNKNNRSNYNRLVQLQPILNSCIRLLKSFYSNYQCISPSYDEKRKPLGHEQTTLAWQITVAVADAKASENAKWQHTRRWHQNPMHQHICGYNRVVRIKHYIWVTYI